MNRLIIFVLSALLLSSNAYARSSSSNDSSGIFGFLLIGFGIYLVVRWLNSKDHEKKIELERIHHNNERTRLENFIHDADQRIKLDSDINGAKKSRKWFAALKSELEGFIDEYKARLLEVKKHASMKGAERIREVKNEKRELVKKLKYLEYQLKTYEEYFPIIEDIKDYLMEDDFSFIKDSADENIDSIDPVQRYLTPEEYKKLPVDTKNQTALENYLNRKHSKVDIGRFYERYLGYLYENDGWDVKYVGIIEGYEDLGRDLVCTKKNKIEIVQAKNWSKFRTIREKHLYQLYATTIHYRIQNEIKKNIEIKPVFCSTIDLSDMAKKVAKELNIDVKKIELKKNYPMIKCNINPTTKEKIYHLPFDQQYDKTIIIKNSGEFYAKDVKEAVSKGFRRAFRYKGQPTSI